MRRRRLAAAVALVTSATALAAAETFHRFEAIATAGYTVTEQCPTTVRLRSCSSRVAGGHEEESENGETTLDSDFLNVLIQGSDCGGEFVNVRAFGPGGVHVLAVASKRAAVTGTVTDTRGRCSSPVDMSWEGTGPIEVDAQQDEVPGVQGQVHEQAARRRGDRHCAAVLDGETVVDGSTSNAEIETLEDLEHDEH